MGSGTGRGRGWSALSRVDPSTSGHPPPGWASWACRGGGRCRGGDGSSRGYMANPQAISRTPTLFRHPHPLSAPPAPLAPPPRSRRGGAPEDADGRAGGLAPRLPRGSTSGCGAIRTGPASSPRSGRCLGGCGQPDSPGHRTGCPWSLALGTCSRRGVGRGPVVSSSRRAVRSCAGSCANPRSFVRLRVRLEPRSDLGLRGRG
jgi:hypothetical protein